MIPQQQLLSLHFLLNSHIGSVVQTMPAGRPALRHVLTVCLLRGPCAVCLLVQMSEGMRSLGQSVYLLTVAVGTYLASALNTAVAAASPHDLWVANNPLLGHYDW